MDYEKMYKEALERVRRLHDRMRVLSSTDALVASSELEFIFPELAESEDERIRKELKEAFEAYDYDIESKWNGIPIRSIFAWLEKQKEPKHDATDAKSERVIKAARSVLNNWLDGTDCPDVSGDFAELEYAIREYDGEEKQKEHQFCPDAPKEKSVGSDFYSSHKDKDVDEIAQDYVDRVKEYNPEPTWDLMQTAVCYGANWQKEQFEKNRLANCDALSKEEYDRETDFAMEIIEKEHRQPTFNDAINYGMRLQKEQKPNHNTLPIEQQMEAAMIAIRGEMPSKSQEWSGEDERVLKGIIGLVDHDQHYGVSNKEMIDWLKSLRPSWKPSEEQMAALEAATVRYQSTGLESLYEDLKKL